MLQIRNRSALLRMSFISVIPPLSFNLSSFRPLFFVLFLASLRPSLPSLPPLLLPLLRLYPKLVFTDSPG